jgi:hypothetical protein
MSDWNRKSNHDVKQKKDVKQEPAGATMTAESKVSPNEVSPHCPFKDLHDEELSCEKCVTRPCEEEDDEKIGEFFIGFCPSCGWMDEYAYNVDVERILMEIKKGIRAESDDSETKKILEERHQKTGCREKLVIF